MTTAPRVTFAKNLHYAWVMFGVAFISRKHLGGTEAPSASPSLLYGFMGPFAAALMER